jgi:hypothetical protein
MNNNFFFKWQKPEAKDIFLEVVLEGMFFLIK